jgi:hypothetical protein
MNHDTNFHADRPLDVAELANLGLGEMAYVKPLRSDEVAQLFPQAPKLQPGMNLFALTDSRETAVANAWAHDLTTVSLH